jgi:hypothetical protein
MIGWLTGHQYTAKVKASRITAGGVDRWVGRMVGGEEYPWDLIAPEVCLRTASNEV